MKLPRVALVILLGLPCPALAGEADAVHLYPDVPQGSFYITESGGAAVTSNLGAGVLFGAGYGLGDHFRLQADYIYSQGIMGSSPTGPVRDESSGYLSLFYDFGNTGGVVPHVGLGLGVRHYDYTNLTNQNLQVQPCSIADGSLAVQGNIGATYAVSPVPGLDLTADYRLAGNATHDGCAADNTISRTNGFVASMPPESLFLIGARYTFGAGSTQKPQADIPGAEPGRPAGPVSFLIFFDWDVDTLSSRARQTVSAALTAIQGGSKAIIEVCGDTDTSAGNAHLARLTGRRIQAVEAALAAGGVPISQISITTAPASAHITLRTVTAMTKPETMAEIVVR